MSRYDKKIFKTYHNTIINIKRYAMLVSKVYDRQRAYEYASKWAFSRNPLFTDYQGIGGNCTNFVSQCIYAGSCIMNFTPVYGWYYVNDKDRSASWTGVDYFFNFITSNSGVGPYGNEVGIDALEIGDVIQLGKNDTGYYHSLLVVGSADSTYLVAAQSDDAFNRRLDSYTYDYARYMHIDGVRIEAIGFEDCYDALYNGERIIANRMNGIASGMNGGNPQGGAGNTDMNGTGGTENSGNGQTQNSTQQNSMQPQDDSQAQSGTQAQNDAQS